jgi:hypothetical protein
MKNISKEGFPMFRTNASREFQQKKVNIEDHVPQDQLLYMHINLYRESGKTQPFRVGMKAGVGRGRASALSQIRQNFGTIKP